MSSPAAPSPRPGQQPPAEGAAYGGAYACVVCGVSVRRTPALRCTHCSCSPFHRACAPRAGQPGARTCPQCAQPSVVRFTGGLVAAPGGLVGLAGPREEEEAGEAPPDGVAHTDGGARPRAGGGGAGGRARCRHGKQRSKCRECRDMLSGEEEEAAAGEGERGRQRQRTGPATRVYYKCEHNRQRSRCKDCGGASICQHNRERSRCKDCGGTGISSAC